MEYGRHTEIGQERTRRVSRHRFRTRKCRTMRANPSAAGRGGQVLARDPEDGAIGSVWGTACRAPAKNLDVVVELEFVGMRAHAHRINFILALVFDPEFDDFLAEDVAFQQELVVVLEGAERFLERAGQ